jgi:hypothetical protein
MALRERLRGVLKRSVGLVAGAVDARDVFVFGGLGMVFAGLWEVYPPLAWVVVGSAIFLLGVRR